MHRIDEIYTKYPYYGAPKITTQLNREKEKVNHKRIERLMGIMGIQAIRPKRNLSKNAKKHVKYPYLLNKVESTAQIMSGELISPIFALMVNGFIW